jgi:hypothetical protein
MGNKAEFNVNDDDLNVQLLGHVTLCEPFGV